MRIELWTNGKLNRYITGYNRAQAVLFVQAYNRMELINMRAILA